MDIKIKEKRGITLIALVVTIILLLILAGVSIAMLIGDSGILEKARIARENTEKAEYKEIIRMAQTEENITTDRLRGKETKLNEIAEILNKDKKLGEGTGTQITKEYQDKENPRLVIKTKEGWVYIVTVDGIEELGKVDGDIPLDIEVKNGDIKYVYKPNYWTNNDVEVSLSIAKEEYKEFKIQYSYDLKTWKDYTEKIVVENNKAIYSRITTGTSVSKSYATGNVINIDKKEAEISTAMNSSNVTTKGFTVNLGVTDGNSGLGKIVWYYKKSDATSYTNEEVIYKDLHSVQAGETTAVIKSKTYDNLTSGTYNVYAEIYDVAGNITRANSSDKPLEITLGAVETATGGSFSPTDWTNGDVTVTLPQKDGFTTRYTTDGTIPTTSSSEYSKAFTVSSNCTITYIYTDGTNIGGAGTLGVTNIDKERPIIGNISSAFTIVSGNTGYITVSNVTDTGESGIAGYYVNTVGQWVSSSSSSFSQAVTTAGTYYIYAKDNAGNVSEVKSCTVYVASAVARIGGTYFSSLGNAVNAVAANNVQTEIVLLADTNEAVTIPTGKNIALNLNGKTLSCTGTPLTNNGTVSIYGGTISSNGNASDGGDIRWALLNNGTAYFLNGTIKSYGGFATRNYGTLNMSGGTFSLTGGDPHTCVFNEGTFNMSAGAISSDQYGLVTVGDGVSNVTGGIITCSSDDAAVLIRGNGSARFIGSTITQNGVGYCLMNSGLNGRLILIHCGYQESKVSGIVACINGVSGTDDAYNLRLYGSEVMNNETKVAVWSIDGGQDDLIWYEASRTTASWKDFVIYYNRHGGADAVRTHHAYIFPSTGAQFVCGFEY